MFVIVAAPEEASHCCRCFRFDFRFAKWSDTEEEVSRKKGMKSERNRLLAPSVERPVETLLMSL